MIIDNFLQQIWQLLTLAPSEVYHYAIQLGDYRMRKPVRCLFVPVVFWSAVSLARADLVTGNLNASLDSGSLTGIMFPVTFSYDSNEVNPVGESFVALESFDFTLLGVSFTLNDIFQGGQAIFEDSIIENVTASFQVILPPNSPVNNITFGFGGPGVIGYIDLNNQPGTGTFTFASPVPEPGLLPLLATMVGLLFAAVRFRKSATHEGRRNKPPEG